MSDSDSDENSVTSEDNEPTAKKLKIQQKDSSNSSDSEEHEPTAKKLKKEQKDSSNSSDSEEEKSQSSDEDDQPLKPNKKEEDDESDTSEKTGKAGNKKKKTPAKGKKGGIIKKKSGYTRSFKLSPALSELLGETELPRHEVVKRIWNIIKERQLIDPNNRQFAICDKPLFNVIGTKRFFTFGMMKYLKNHFIKD